MAGLDVGLQELRKAIASLPPPAFAEVGPVHQDVQAIAQRLHITYEKGLRDVIIKDQFEADDAEASLTFPRKLTSFIPQAYRLARYDSKDLHLEREDEWSKRDVRDDIGELVLRYLESPYSVETPLLILGHPGSGKSLLTEVLAGHLTYPAYTTIRLKLRDYDRTMDLRTQLEKRIYKDTSGMDVRWARFVDALRMTPPVVILDGYDELLQATGQEYASFLDEMRQFQGEQAQQGWPVRVIVTSRVTLIDKVRVPWGTTVVRLEEFDPGRRDAWAEVWNAHNQSYFQHTKIRPFRLPQNDKLLDLARQPLLLLMLAIYDSARNELSSQPDIDKTLLYDRLLRRFIDRELSKGDAGREYRASPEADKKKAVDLELERLGVVAIGMFNRQDLKIRRDQLDDDLRYFGAERAGLPSVRPLGQAERVLGGFFFIQESKVNFDPNDPADSSSPAHAFEFLHNTFGEFLTAGFIVRRALDEARTISKLPGDDPDILPMRAQKLSRPNEGWLGCLIHTPLHTRPVILTMLREWSRHQLGGQQSREALLSALDALVIAQLKLALNDLTIPNPDPAQRQLSPYAPLSARGQIATYTLNLVVLRAYLGDDSYTLREAGLGGDPSSCGPWDSLTSLWRSWFTLDSLRALADVLCATRNDEGIIIAGASALRDQSLDAVIERCQQGWWSLLDIPMETWEKLADLFVTAEPALAARRPRFVALLEAAIGQSIEGLEDGAEEQGIRARRLAFFWIQALRIGATSQQGKLLIRASSGLHNGGGNQGPGPFAGMDLRCLLALAGWSREVGDFHLAEFIFLQRELFNRLPSALTRRPGGNFVPDAVDDPAVAGLLTHKQAEDLRWVLGALQALSQ